MTPVSGNGYQYGQQAHERSINPHYLAFGQQEHCSWGLDSEHAMYAFGGEMSLPSEGLTASFKPTYAYQDLSFHSSIMGDPSDMANVVIPQLEEQTFQQQSTDCKPRTGEPKKNAVNCQSRSAQPSSQQCIVKRLDGAKLQDNNGNPVDGIVCHRTIYIGSDASLAFGRGHREARQPLRTRRSGDRTLRYRNARIGTRSEGKDLEANKREDIDVSGGERVEVRGETFGVRFRTLRHEYLAFCNVAYLL